MHVYLLQRLVDGYRYIGITAEPLRRLREHNSGYNRATKRHRPYRMWLLAECDSTKEARNLERKFKSGYGRRKIDVMLANGRAVPVTNS